MTKNVIIHGDARDHMHKVKTPIDCVITDPPYGIDFKSNMAKTKHGKEYTQKIEGDLDPHAAVELFHKVMGCILPHLADEAEIYVFTAWYVLDIWMPAVKALTCLDTDGYAAPDLDHGIKLKQMLIWDKGYPGLGDLNGNWGCGHEVILYLKKGRRPVKYRRSAIIAHDKIPRSQNVHPTEKPVGLIRPLIEMSTDPGDLIIDPFSGSGSTSVAAQQLGRNSLAFEIDERYVKVGRERLANMPLVAG